MSANVLVIVVDGLRASALGAYGNTSFATPALDQLAAESLLFDWSYAPSPELIDNYRALWNSINPSRLTHNADDESNAPPPVSLPRMFADRGYATSLVTDEPLLKSLAAAADFHETVQLASIQTSHKQYHRTNDPAQSELAHLFAAATESLEQRTPNQPRLLWLHSRGMYGTWDAPLELQESLLDEGDPPSVESSAPPDLVLQPNDDPDALFRYACAYAAQIMLLDTRIENILAAIDADHNEWLVMLMGARGFPLGEHGRIGGVDPRLFADQLHVPWLIRFPNNIGRLVRSSALTSHADVLPTLSDWTNGGIPSSGTMFAGSSALPLASSKRAPWRDAIIATSATACAIRTPAWCLRIDQPAGDTRNPSGESSSKPELYVRPDDRWEANDIAKLCPEVVEELHAAMNNTIRSRSSDPPRAC